MLLFAIAASAGAAPPYDGTKPMKCAIQTVMVCSDPNACVRGSAQTVNLPGVLDESGRLVLIKRLVREGLLTICS